MVQQPKIKALECVLLARIYIHSNNGGEHKKVNVAGRIYSCYYDNGFNGCEPDPQPQSNLKNYSRVIYVANMGFGITAMQIFT